MKKEIILYKAQIPKQYDQESHYGTVSILQSKSVVATLNYKSSTTINYKNCTTTNIYFTSFDLLYLST